MSTSQIETYYGEIVNEDWDENNYFLIRLTNLWGDCWDFEEEK